MESKVNRKGHPLYADKQPRSTYNGLYLKQLGVGFDEAISEIDHQRSLIHEWEFMPEEKLHRMVKKSSNHNEIKAAMDQLNMQKYIKCKEFDVGSRFKRTINDEKVG